LTEEQAANLDAFIADLGEYATNPFVPASIALWSGPLTLQDGSELAPAGQIVEPLDVWYLEQLLEGMTGASS
jgi:simple sugar transport system substrate-binding protein